MGQCMEITCSNLLEKSIVEWCLLLHPMMLTVLPWLVSEVLHVLEPPKLLSLIVISHSCHVSLQSVQDDTVDHSSWLPLLLLLGHSLGSLPTSLGVSSPFLSAVFLATSLPLILVLFSFPAPLSTVQPVFENCLYVHDSQLHTSSPHPLLKEKVESGLLSLSGWMRRGLGKSGGPEGNHSIPTQWIGPLPILLVRHLFVFKRKLREIDPFREISLHL